jgi:hypothetical protein
MIVEKDKEIELLQLTLNAENRRAKLAIRDKNQLEIQIKQLKDEKQNLQRDILKKENHHTKEINNLKTDMTNLQNQHTTELNNLKTDMTKQINKETTSKLLAEKKLEDMKLKMKKQSEEEKRKFDKQLSQMATDYEEKLKGFTLVDDKLVSFVKLLANVTEKNIVEKYNNILREDEILKLSQRLTSESTSTLSKEIEEQQQQYSEINAKIASITNLNLRNQSIENRSKLLEHLSQNVKIMVQQLSNQSSGFKNSATLLTQFSQGTHCVNKQQAFSDELYLHLSESEKNYKHTLELLQQAIDPYENALKLMNQKVSDRDNSNIIEKALTAVREQEKVIAIVTESFEGIQQKVDNWKAQSETVALLIKEQRILTNKQKDLMVELSDFNSEIIRLNNKVEDEEIDDEDRNDALELKDKKLVEYNRKSSEVNDLNKSIQSVEKKLFKFLEFGEVARLFKSNSDKRSIKDYIFIKELGGRTGNVSLYERNGEQCILKKFFVGTDHSMLRREASIRVLPSHPLIVPINAIFHCGDVAYVEIPYIEGGTLRDWISEGTRSAVEIQNMIRLIAQAINYLHSHDMIHCDLKPENILIKKIGEVSIPMLCDFELSRNKNDISTNTTIGGSFAYMSPVSILSTVNSCDI